MRDIIAKLKALKHEDANPSEAWLKSNRDILLSQIKNTIGPAPQKVSVAENFWQGMSMFMPKVVVYKVMRPVMAMCLIMALGVGGWIATVEASYESVPGDLLYGAKRATETTQVVVVTAMGTKNAQTKLHVEFAKRRADETQKLVSANDPENIHRVTDTVSDLKNEINKVSSNLEEMKTSDKESTAQTAKDVSKNVEQITEVLTGVKADLMAQPVASSTPGGNLSAQINEVKEMAKDTAVKGVEVMVAKHLQGDTSVSKEEVKQSITDQLQLSVKDAAVSTQNVEEVKKAVESVKSEVKDLVATATSTKDLSTKVEEASKSTQNASELTKGISSTTEQISDKAMVMLSTGNLQQAMDLVKEATSVNKEAERTLDSTLKTVQNALPTVVVVKDAISTGQATSSVNVLITATTTSHSVTSTGVVAPKVIIIVTSTAR